MGRIARRLLCVYLFVRIVILANEGVFEQPGSKEWKDIDQAMS